MGKVREPNFELFCLLCVAEKQQRPAGCLETCSQKEGAVMGLLPVHRGSTARCEGGCTSSRRIQRPGDEEREQSTPEGLAKPRRVVTRPYYGRRRKPALVEQVGGGAVRTGPLIWLCFNEFPLKHGSVPPPARGCCRARSHRRCQPGAGAAHCEQSQREQRRERERCLGEGRLCEDRAARNAGKSS